MKYKYLSLMLCSSLLLTACGSDNADEQPVIKAPVENPSDQDPATDTQIENTLNNIAGITLRETILSGLVDTLIYGTDEIVEENTPCQSGSYQKTATRITLNQCVGLYGTNMAASGIVDFSDKAYSFNNLKLMSADGESQDFKGVLTRDLSDSVETYATSKLELTAKERNAAQALIDVSYTLTDYQLMWEPQGNSTVQLSVRGKLLSTGGEDGDFDVAFNTTQPFYIKLNQNEEMDGYPYAGLLKITDLAKDGNKITLNVINKDLVLYEATFDGRTLINKQLSWANLLTY